MPAAFVLSSYASESADLLLLHMPKSLVEASVLSSGTGEAPVLLHSASRLRRTAPLMAAHRLCAQMKGLW